MPVGIFHNEIKIAYRLMIMYSKNKVNCSQVKYVLFTFCQQLAEQDQQRGRYIRIRYHTIRKS